MKNKRASHCRTIRDMWSGIKQTSRLRQKEDQMEGNLDRADEQSTLFNSFIVGTNSAFFNLSQKDLSSALLSQE